MREKLRRFPKPSVTIETQPFWDATAKKKLLLKRCQDCCETHFYPRTLCPFCFSAKTEWYEASGKGHIYTFSVMRRVPIPYVIAFVTLAEGVTIMTNIIECDFESISINQEVELTFRKTEGDFVLPVFTPVFQ